MSYPTTHATSTPESRALMHLLNTAPSQSKKNPETIERGAAALYIELSEGIVTVSHGTEGIELMSAQVNEGTWDALFKAIGYAILAGKATQ